MSKLNNSDYQSLISELILENAYLRSNRNKDTPTIGVLEIETLSDLTVVEELKGKLRISGILLAEGIWNGVLYTKDEIKKMYNRFKDKLSKLKIIAEHEKLPEFKNKKLGGHIGVEWSDTLGAILYSGEITDPKAINLVKNGQFKGTSMKLKIKREADGMLIKGVDLEPMDNSLTSSPACQPALIVSKEEMNKEGNSIIHNFYGIVKESKLDNKDMEVKEEEMNKTEGNTNTDVTVTEPKVEDITPTEGNNTEVTSPIVEEESPIVRNLENITVDKLIEELSGVIKRKRIIYEYDNNSSNTFNLDVTEEFSYHPYNDKFIVVKSFNTEDEARVFVENIKGKRIFLSEEENLAKWTRKFINDLPDSAFAYVAPGGKKDEEGKTVPRNLRYLPYKDASGKVDLPHLRNALARVSHTDLPKSVQDKIKSKLEAVAKKHLKTHKMRIAVNTVEMKWEETDDYIRSGHGNPENFDNGSFRTIVIDKSKGIKAIVACPKGHFSGGQCNVGVKVQSFLFPKDKFTKAQAQAWFKTRSNKAKMKKEGLAKEGDVINSKEVEELTEEPKKEEVKTETPIVGEEKKEDTKVEPSKEEVPETPEKSEVVKEEPKVEDKEPETKVEPKKEEVKEEPKVETPKEEPTVPEKKEEVKEVPKEEIKEVPKEEPKVEAPKPLTKEEIVSEIVKNKDLLADLIMKGRIKYGDYDD